MGYSRTPNAAPLIRPINDNTTTAMFNSNTSTTLNSAANAARFAELDASIKANQSEIKQMNNKFDILDNRMIDTMSACHENSNQLVIMYGQINQLQRTIQTIADQTSSLTENLKIINTEDRIPQLPLKTRTDRATMAHSFNPRIINKYHRRNHRR